MKIERVIEGAPQIVRKLFKGALLFIWIIVLIFLAIWAARGQSSGDITTFLDNIFYSEDYFIPFSDDVQLSPHEHFGHSRPHTYKTCAGFFNGAAAASLECDGSGSLRPSSSGRRGAGASPAQGSKWPGGHLR